MWKQRVVLKHRVDRPVMRREVFNFFVEQKDLAAGRLFKTSRQPEQRGLTATRWP